MIPLTSDVFLMICRHSLLFIAEWPMNVPSAPVHYVVHPLPVLSASLVAVIHLAED